MLLLPTVRIFVFTLYIAVSLTAFAQVRPPDNRLRNCSISGRVTIGGQPAANAQVIASEITQSRNAQSSVRSAADGSPIKTVFKVRVDADGLYQFTGLPTGRYQVRVSAHAFISAENDLDQGLGRIITLDDGEAREKVDFALVRGGVITGRVADAEGHVAIAQFVHLFRFENDRLTPVGGNEGLGVIQTDDRGIYRAYGLRPGSYVVGSGNGTYFDRAGNVRNYRYTFHPDSLEEKQAVLVKLSAGEEKTGIDIKLAAGTQYFVATGRVVDGETGKPIANVTIRCNKVTTQGTYWTDHKNATEQTDSAGDFRLTELSSGRYAVELLGYGNQGIDYYAEDQFFEISGEDASGIEIKATTGGVLSGVAAIEGTPDAATKAKFAQILIDVSVQDKTLWVQPVTIKPDNTFRATGLPPGRVWLQPRFSPNRTFQLLRIERGGNEIKNTLVIAKGEKINDLRLIFGKGTGVIRGQVQVIGELPKDWKLSAYAHRIVNGQDPRFTPGFDAEVDDHGRFTIESLFGGEYELTVQARPIVWGTSGNVRFPPPAKQTINVTNGSEVQVNVRFDLNGKQEER
jgi:protocatechuate 3,4-dioxygenase beta subunit